MAAAAVSICVASSVGALPLPSLSSQPPSISDLSPYPSFSAPLASPLPTPSPSAAAREPVCAAAVVPSSRPRLAAPPSRRRECPCPPARGGGFPGARMASMRRASVSFYLHLSRPCRQRTS
ncbi:hypothetical protein C2845_PM01G16230 [Panicum miliaceum]|uniref:Uncharacterized protein n=1 Tax=Panicum miliaceum TaxID=4540 RepID=A0A3L6THI8_PANMI|nr:hypothetical protein C2845_PM01G16230 [Panicum miliaceum]